MNHRFMMYPAFQPNLTGPQAQPSGAAPPLPPHFAQLPFPTHVMPIPGQLGVAAPAPDAQPGWPVQLQPHYSQSCGTDNPAQQLQQQPQFPPPVGQPQFQSPPALRLPPPSQSAGLSAAPPPPPAASYHHLQVDVQPAARALPWLQQPQQQPHQPHQQNQRPPRHVPSDVEHTGRHAPKTARRPGDACVPRKPKVKVHARTPEAHAEYLKELKTLPCQHFRKGRCNHKNCRFSHEVTPALPPPPAALDAGSA